MDMHYYELGPVDMGWTFLPELHEFITRFNCLDLIEPDREIINTVKRLAAHPLFLYSLSHEKQREAPRVLVYPLMDCALVAIMWKVDNNGTTHVVSNAAIPGANVYEVEF